MERLYTLVCTGFFLACIGLPFTAVAGVSLPWSTTYSCSDWNQYSQPLNCDNLGKNGAWTVSPDGYFEQITAAANYPGGGGGKGQRHWIGDGTNNNSGGTRITFNTPQSKFWIRWYMRWQSGFKQFGQYKAIYGFGTNGSNGPLINFFYPNGGMSFEYLNSGNETCNGCGWGADFYKTGVSDGSWVYVEAMIDVAGRRLKLWVGPQQRLVIDASGVQFKENAVSYLMVGENQKNVNNGRSMYVDYDDIAISTTRFIGPVAGGGGGSTPPSGLSVPGSFEWVQ